MNGGTCEKCGAPGEYRQDFGAMLCGSCNFDAAFDREQSKAGTKRLFKKYADGAEAGKPAGGAT